MLKCIKGGEGGEEEKTGNNILHSWSDWEGRSLKTAKTLTPHWPELQFLFSHIQYMHTHTHSLVHYFSVSRTNEHKDKGRTEGYRLPQELM